MYEKINTKENYNMLLQSGMFWEFHQSYQAIVKLINSLY